MNDSTDAQCSVCGRTGRALGAVKTGVWTCLEREGCPYWRAAAAVNRKAVLIFNPPGAAGKSENLLDGLPVEPD